MTAYRHGLIIVHPPVWNRDPFPFFQHPYRVGRVWWRHQPPGDRAGRRAPLGRLHLLSVRHHHAVSQAAHH
jgi:hypothetical protein